MRLNARELLRFSAKFLAAFMALILAWPFFAPIYNAVTVTIANVFFSLVEQPDITLLQPAGNSVAIYIRDVENPKAEPRLFAYFDYPHNGLAVFLALILATPALPWRQRLRVMMIGIGLLIGIHSALFVPKTRFEYIQFLAAEGVPIADSMYLMYSWVGRALVPASYIAPFLLWALFTFRYWFPKPAAPAVPPSPQPQRHLKEARP